MRFKSGSLYPSPDESCVEAIMSKALPGDMTIKGARDYFMASDVGLELASLTKGFRVISVRFMIAGKLAPDDMTLGEWRKAGGTIEIDDSDGGLRVPESKPKIDRKRATGLRVCRLFIG